MKERRERVLDAVAATKAAMQSGVVPGGETIYLTVREILSSQETVSGSILYHALEKPFLKLLENAGLPAGQLLERLRLSEEKNAGIDVSDGQVKNLLKAGIIDPVSVPIQALKNAVSVAIQIMTTGVCITPIKEQK